MGGAGVLAAAIADHRPHAAAGHRQLPPRRHSGGRGRLIRRSQRQHAAAEKAVLLFQAAHLFRVEIGASAAKEAGHGRRVARFQDDVGVVIEAATTGWIKVTYQWTEGNDQFLERMRLVVA